MLTRVPVPALLPKRVFPCLGALALVACGRIGFDPSDAGVRPRGRGEGAVGGEAAGGVAGDGVGGEGIGGAAGGGGSGSLGGQAGGAGGGTGGATPGVGGGGGQGAGGGGTGGAVATGGVTAMGGGGGMGGGGTGGMTGTGGGGGMGGTVGSGGAIGAGGTVGTGGMVGTGGAGTGGAGAGGAMGACNRPASAVTAAYFGMWRGTARRQSISYTVELSVSQAPLNGIVGVFYVPRYECGGITTLRSVGSTLVYQESLLFDPRGGCVQAGTTTLTPVSASMLNYEFNDGTYRDRGEVTRFEALGTSVPVDFQGVWSGPLTQTNPAKARSVHLAITQGGLAGIMLQAVYPNEGCGGFSTLESVNGNTIQVLETLSTVSSGCSNQGRIELVLQSCTSMTYRWTKPGSTTVVTGTLTRR